MAPNSGADPEKTQLVEKPKSNKGKYIALTIVVLLALTVTFIVLYVQEITKDPNEGKVDRSVKVCIDPACVSAAESLNKAMNRNADPCDDFYEFACGGWNKTEVMPDDKARWQVFDVLQRNLVKNLRGSLTVPSGTVIPDGPTATATQKIQQYFASCMDTEAIERVGVNSLKAHLIAEYGADWVNWPFIGDVAPGVTSLKAADVVRTAFSYGNTLGLFSNFILADQKDSSKNVINFDTGRFTLDRFSLLNDTMQEARDAYVTYGAEVAILLAKRINSARPEVSLDQAKTLFGKILQFERTLAEATLSPEETRNETKLQNPVTLEKFGQDFPPALGLTGQVWASIFGNAWPEAASQITVNTVINVREPAYFDKLMRELAVAADDENILSNYFAWKVIEPFISRLDEEFRAIQLKYLGVVSGVKAAAPRAESCVAIVNNQFPNAVGSLYVRNHFRKEAKEELQVMINYLIDAFRNIIKTSYWLTEVTRQKALEKADKIVARLAYDDYLMDNLTQLNSEHREFVAVKDYLTNFLNGRKFATRVEGKLYVKGNKPTDWITGSAVVNAFYSPNHNSISFPAGILQAPFLGNGYPSYWNFAAIGTVIGHEITHGFDDQGAQSDGDGNLVDWWDEESKNNFKERAQGIIDQYSSYNHLGVQLKGFNNQGENIADNGGLKESYDGYRLYRKALFNDTVEPRLPGFETFNNDQMFYLSYAQVWCGDYRRQEMELQASRAHSPGRFRVIGPLQNSRTFAQAYRCSEDTYMNPKKKNAVW